MIKSLLITNNGKHSAADWAKLAADELIDIGSQSPEALIKEANVLKEKATKVFTRYHQTVMDKENTNIKAGNHAVDLPYKSEDHAKLAVTEIVNASKGGSFEKFFSRSEVMKKIENLCNHWFKSAMSVERQHYHSELALKTPVTK